MNDPYSVARGPPEIVDLTTEISLQSSAKRKAEARIAVRDDEKKPKHGSLSGKLVTETYWDSPEAKKLFLGNPKDARRIEKVLDERIERLLQQANRTVDGWKDMVDKHNKDNLCSSYDVFIIRQRCSILCLVYIHALEEMNSVRWIEDCCIQAIADCSKIGIEAAATSERTVAGWNILLRSNRERFPLPNPKVLNKQKHPLPELLEYMQEEITNPWLGYCFENLANLTVELARNEINNRLIPNAASASSTSLHGASTNTSTTNDNGQSIDGQLESDRVQHKQARGDYLLQSYLEHPISITTTWRWLKRLGFLYSHRKKSFFVDGHERPDVIFKRNEFCTLYLRDLEPRMHRWIQVTAETVEAWKREKKLSDDDNRGYSYVSTDNKSMVELHVDDFPFLHEYATTVGFGSFGGNLSIRMPPGVKPLMVFGQDESVYNQFLLGNRQWVTPGGQRALLPKTEGLSLMISGLQSRETGFGVTRISQMQLDEINHTRRDQTYIDVDAALAIHGQALKNDLKQSPFVVYFELGSNNEGYWTYNHMAIQFEDYVDCLKVLFPQFDFAFIFDHSQGHAKKLTNGLDAYSMNRGYRGVQPKMHESTIMAEDGYLGMHERNVDVGDTQSFVFQPGDGCWAILDDYAGERTQPT